MASPNALIRSHLFLLAAINCVLPGASARTVKGNSGSAHDQSSLFESPSDLSSHGLDQDMVSQHMSKLYDRYNREPRLKEGNTIRSFRASRGA